VKRLLERTDKDISRIYHDLGLDFEARWFSLLYLLNEQSPMTITGAAESLGYSHPAVNKLAAQMTRKGLVASSKDRKDKRRRLLRLTKKGRETAILLEPVWEEIRAVLRELLEASDDNLLLAIEDFERLLGESDLYSRIFDRLKPRLLGKIEILEYSPRYKKDFKSLNSHWLKRHFGLEERDKEMLDDPHGSIIEQGGAVLFARLEGKIVGTCALVRHEAHIFELTKMAVAEKARRRSVGAALTLAAIKKASDLGACEIYLETHPTFKAAQHLYRRHGFRRVASSPIPKRYRRKRVCMRLVLGKEAS
jgi:N-acetylglutamate synthase-like GNAT family acetyltransferase/DNA-binding MarR family transcriptional regulator